MDGSTTIYHLLQIMSETEKRIIWAEIKQAAPGIFKSGGNAVDVLLWSQGRRLSEVRGRLQRVRDGQILTQEGEEQPLEDCQDEELIDNQQDDI